MTRTLTLLLILLGLGCPQAGDAQDISGKQLHAWRLKGDPPRLDGRLDDEAWISAEAIDDFVQGEPANMDAATDRTVVRVAYDERYIYVGVTCLTQDPSTIAEQGWIANIGPSMRLQPSPRLQTSLSVTYSPGHDSAQWIVNEDVDGDGEKDNIFGQLRRNTIDVRIRGTYAFSRDLTLEAYMQPFVSEGRYFDIKRLARARSFEFTPAVVSENPDFNSKSLQSNVVLRWEYQRGSTIYFVWQMSTSDKSNPGMFNPWRDLQDAFGGERTNIFLVKTNYWFGL